jgi:hypothetical protein
MTKCTSHEKLDQSEDVWGCGIIFNWLVVWNMFDFSYWAIIIPSDELIFFRGVGHPPTSKDVSND